MLYVLLYVVGFISFFIYDAIVGFGIDFDGVKNPPVIFVAAFWIISIPIIIIYFFFAYLDSLKSKRLEKEQEQSKLKRIALQEQEMILNQIDLEMQENKAPIAPRAIAKLEQR